MQYTQLSGATERYADCIAKSQRVRWDIDEDVIRSRDFDLTDRFMPDGMTLADRLPFLSLEERLRFGQIQGRTYANMFCLVERFIGAKMLDLSRAHWLGDQTALQALVRFTEEELKHQALFSRIEAMLAALMPPGYRFVPHANQIAETVLGAQDWAVLALTCHIELFTQDHYLQSLQGSVGISDIFLDVFRFHWKEESQHAVVDELEWRRVHAGMSLEEVDLALDDLIQLIHAFDAVLSAQAEADHRYFMMAMRERLSPTQAEQVFSTFWRAYRFQYLVTGFMNARFNKLIGELLNAEQRDRLETAIRPYVDAATSF